MTEQEIADLIRKYGSPAIRRERTITSRRYNLVVFRNSEAGKEIVETIEYLTRKQASELKAAYLREDNLFCDIVEDVTIDRDGKELTFPPRNEVPVVKGLGGFNTPEATKLIIERDRRNNRNKASFARKAKKVTNGKTIRYTNSFTDPKSPLYPMYLDNVKRKGFTVRNKITGMIFRGLQNEVTEYIVELAKSGVNIKTDLDISFNGV
jgi:hypothetical protein